MKNIKKQNKIHSAIYLFLACKGENTLRREFNPKNLDSYVTPRRWEMASKMLYETNNPQSLKAIIGKKLTKQFCLFCQVPGISIEDVLNGNYTEEEIKDISKVEKFANVASLLEVSNDDMPIVRTFLKKMDSEMCKIFEAQWSQRNNERKLLLKKLRKEELKQKITDKVREK